MTKHSVSPIAFALSAPEGLKAESLDILGAPVHGGLPAPDLVRTEQLMNEYGIELLGPPLVDLVA